VNALFPTWANEFFALSWQISVTVLALLCYSGPLVPLTATLFLKKASVHCFRKNRSLLFQLGIIQALSFVPFLLAELFHQPEAYYALIIPFWIGALMFVGTLAYCVYFVISAIRGHLAGPFR